MRPGDSEAPPDSLSPITVSLDAPEDPVLLELTQLVDEVIALRSANCSDVGTVTPTRLVYPITKPLPPT